MIIGVLGAVIIGGTMAAFHDVEVAGGNVFTAGTLDLRLDGGDGTTGTWSSPDDWAPGEIVEGTIVLRNYGNIDADNLTVTFENDFDNFTADKAATDGLESFDGDDGDSEHEMARELIIIERWWGGTNLLAITDGVFDNTWVEAADKIRVEDNIITLNELEKHSRDGAGGPLVLDGIAAGAYWNWIMNIEFDYDAPNELQGDKLTTEITFRLEQ